MLADARAIEECIPHRLPMRLVDQLLACEEERATVLALVTAAWPGCRQGRVDPVLLIELVSQAAATLVGWNRRHEEKQGGRGWLVGVRKTRIHSGGLVVGTELICEVELAYKVENYAVYKGWVRDRTSRKLAEAELQTYRPDTLSA